MSIFLVVVALVVAAAHVYFWRRLVRAPRWPARGRHVLAAVVLLLGLSVPVGLSLSHWIGPERALPFSWIGGVWAGTTFFLLMLLLAVDIPRGLAALARPLITRKPVDLGRRQLISRVVAGSVGASAAGLSAVALAAAARAPDLVRVRVPVGRLPAALDGFRIVQLSDMHVGPIRGREFVADVVERSNALEPDLVAITGDLADASAEDAEDALAPLAGLRARHGVFFVTGNHEYFWGVESQLAGLARLGVRTLRNERVTVGRAGASIDVAGIDDASAWRYGRGHGADIDAAMSGRDAARPVVLLAHQPKQVFDAQKHGVDLVLSGHTHGGQIFPFGLFVRLVQPAVRGLHRFGPSWLYVSCGTGTWGPPMRLGTSAEITLLELSRSGDDMPAPR